MTEKPKLHTIQNWIRQKPNSQQILAVLTPLCQKWSPDFLPLPPNITPEKALQIVSQIEPTFPEDSTNPFFRDLRNVECPRNYIKAALALKKLKHNDILEIWIDNGQPIENVPMRLRQDGHQIIERTKQDTYWILKIQKSS